jgi:hypothetical protein
MTIPMTIQEAAHLLLREELRRPTTSKELAQIALSRAWARSNAQKPVDSLAQSLEKNIRDGVYNKPELKFVHSPQGIRLIALPEWEDKGGAAQTSAAPASTAELKVRIRSDLLEQVQLAVQSKIARSFDETVELLLRQGLTAEATEIRNGLMKQLNELSKGQVSQDELTARESEHRLAKASVPTEPPIPSPERTNRRANAAGQETVSQNDLIIPLIEVLREKGGSAPKPDVVAGVFERFKALFSSDYHQEYVGAQPAVNYPGIPRWQKNVEFARNKAKDLGLIKRESMRGVWELTKNGWSYK